MTDSTIFENIQEALDRCMPFAAWAMPGQSEVEFLGRPLQITAAPEECRAEIGNPGWNGFFINFFANQEDYTAGIGAEGVPYPDNGHLCPDIHPTNISTSKAEHNNMVRLTVARLNRQKNRPGKVVLARVQAVESEKSPVEVFRSLCVRYPDTFRYICYTPETGIWTAATPEVLLDYDVETGKLHTMALAGTRMKTDQGPWDEKNQEEHEFVVDDIVKTLILSGFSVKKTAPKNSGLHFPAGTLDGDGNLCFGQIVHKLTPITGTRRKSKHTCRWKEVEDLFRRLSPTPAVCGYPFEDAFCDILEYEPFERHCYGGYVGVKEGSRIRAFVNLRCAFAAPVASSDKSGKGYLYNIYAGGGITAQSDPEEEWKETVLKSQAILRSVYDIDEASEPRQ